MFSRQRRSTKTALVVHIRIEQTYDLFTHIIDVICFLLCFRSDDFSFNQGIILEYSDCQHSTATYQPKSES